MVLKEGGDVKLEEGDGVVGLEPRDELSREIAPDFWSGTLAALSLVYKEHLHFDECANLTTTFTQLPNCPPFTESIAVHQVAAS